MVEFNFEHIGVWVRMLLEDGPVRCINHMGQGGTIGTTSARVPVVQCEIN